MTVGGGDKQNGVDGVLELLLLDLIVDSVLEADSRIPQPASLTLLIVNYVQTAVADSVPFSFSLCNFDLSFS